MSYSKDFILVLALCLPSLLNASEASTLVPFGNFALPFSQQPGPFYSFGQNINAAYQLQIYTAPNYLKGSNQKYFGTTTGLLYALSDYSSLLLNLPYYFNQTVQNTRSHGIYDSNLTYEYAFLSNEGTTSATTATIVASLGVPTGDETKEPPTGNGTYSYFLGGTYNDLAPKNRTLY